MNIEGDYLVFEIDNDYSMNYRYKRQDCKQYRLQGYNLLSKNINNNSNHKYILQTNITKRGNIHITVIDKVVNHLPAELKITLSIKNIRVKNDAYEVLANKGKKHEFKINQFVHEDGYYLAKIKLTPDKPVAMETMAVECCVCYEEDRQTSVANYFQCSHKNLCDDCYSQLKFKCCPYCKASIRYN